MEFPSVGMNIKHHYARNTAVVNSRSIKNQGIHELLIVVKNTEDTTCVNLVGDSILYQFNEHGILYFSKNRQRTAQLYLNEANEIDSMVEIYNDHSISNEKQFYSFLKTDTGSIYYCKVRANESERTFWLDNNNILIRSEISTLENTEVYTYNPETYEAVRTVFKNGKKDFEVYSRWVIKDGMPKRFYGSKKNRIPTSTMSPDYSGYFEVNADGKAILPRAYLSLCKVFNTCGTPQEERTKANSIYLVPKSHSWHAWNPTYDPKYVLFQQVNVYLKKEGKWQQVPQL